MELVPIGEAARRLGINASALRYYEERGLLRPTARQGGRRVYDSEQLRRLAFIQTMRQLGASLDSAAAVLDQPGDRWREAVRAQIDSFDELIARAAGARDFLRHALHCPADHPVRECPRMIEALDRRLAGTTVAEIAAEHGHGGAAGEAR